jgi:hypothetical protein
MLLCGLAPEDGILPALTMTLLGKGLVRRSIRAREKAVVLISLSATAFFNIF